MAIGKAKKAKSSKAEWRQFRIELVGKRRADGSLFITSPNLAPFSAVLSDGNWRRVIPVLETFLRANFGRVKVLRLIEDASQLVLPDLEQMPEMPPAYVVAELITNRVGAH